MGNEREAEKVPKEKKSKKSVDPARLLLSKATNSLFANLLPPQENVQSIWTSALSVATHAVFSSMPCIPSPA